MKFIKYAFLTLIIAIATDITVAFAYSSPSATAIYKELSKNTSQWTDYRTKNTWTTQKYENVRTYTWMTDPCPKCQVSAKPVTESGNVYVAVVTSEGDTKNFTAPSTVNSPDDYRLNIWRLDTTLLTTIHSSVWTING